MKNNKKKFVCSLIVSLVSVVVATTTILLVCIFDVSDTLKVLLIVLSAFLCSVGLLISALMSLNIYEYECKNCKTRFQPSIKDDFKTSYTLTSKKLKCPNCKQTTYCKRKIKK